MPGGPWPASAIPAAHPEGHSAPLHDRVDLAVVAPSFATNARLARGHNCKINAIMKRSESRTIVRPRVVSLNLPFVDTYGDAGLGLLGDPTRRAIFELLARRPRAVGELATELPISRPAVSQHLKVLKDAGLVVDRAEGTRRVYRLNPDGVAALRAYLDRIWEDALTAFQKAVEAAPMEFEQEQ
jgi:DNA-binding transcriptional ArsR family regulator